VTYPLLDQKKVTKRGPKTNKNWERCRGGHY